MPEASSFIYPLIAIAVVIIFTLVIKLRFHSTKTLPNHRKKTFDSSLAAYYYSNRSTVVTFVILTVLLYATWQLWSISLGYAPSLKPFYIIFGSLFLVQLLVASFQKPFTVQSHGDSIDKFKPVIIVPIYNESEKSLKEGLASFFTQTKLPAEIHIVDDGSKSDYKRTRKWFEKEAAKHNIHATWTKQTNAGKREAHATALRYADMSDDAIIITIDSDSQLDKHAIEEGLKPFSNPAVQSVAGLVIAKNAQQNLIARITDNIFVSGQQLIDRSFMSQFGSVLVNSGGLAFYRSAVIKKSLESGYTDETFFGRKVTFSDDSYLTLFALLSGLAVQQPSSIVFTDMPVTFSHHIRQQLRWARGSFIRSWWRLRHLSFGSFGHLRQVLGWSVFIAFTVVIVQLFALIPMTTGKLPPVELLYIPLIFSFLQATRYLSVKRSDMSNKSQVFTFLLSPLAMLWSIFVLRPIRLYGMLTCLKTGWGTRSDVEILYHSDEQTA